jgi:hypothetical protein
MSVEIVMLLLMYLCEGFIVASFYGKFSSNSFLFTATGDHVQQYGEVNQLGGVFVNVRKMQLNFHRVRNFTAQLISGSTIAKWYSDAYSRISAVGHSTVRYFQAIESQSRLRVKNFGTLS